LIAAMRQGLKNFMSFDRFATGSVTLINDHKNNALFKGMAPCDRWHWLGYFDGGPMCESVQTTIDLPDRFGPIG